MIVVSVHTARELDETVLGNPTMLYERPFTSTFNPSYGVTPDGQRFIDVEVTDAELAPGELVIVQNWFQELKRLVSMGN